MEGLVPVIVADGPVLYLASNIEFFDECRAQKSGLGQTAAFQQALARVGEKGNALSYISPRLYAQLRRTQSLNPDMPPQAKRVLDFVASRLPQRDRPSISIRTNLADGILIKSDANHSLKQDAMMLTAYNPITVGLLAAMAIPAFQKVRQSSQEKAVLNNLRQFMAAGDQFCLENGVAVAAYADLVGPDKYIRALNPVAGEDYRALRYEIGKPLVVKLRDGRVIRYAP